MTHVSVHAGFTQSMDLASVSTVNTVPEVKDAFAKVVSMVPIVQVCIYVYKKWEVHTIFGNPSLSCVHTKLNRKYSLFPHCMHCAS